MIFENQQINTDDLPHGSESFFQSVEPKYITVSLIASSIFWGLILVGGVVMHLFVFDGEGPGDEKFQYILLALAILAIIGTFLAVQGAKVKAYALRQHDILFRTGYIWFKEIAVPFNRIQHSEVVQGPIDRMFKLSTLKLYTAGGSQSDLKIPGLNPEKANRLKEFVTLKVGLNEEE